MILVIYILLGIIVLVIISVWIDTYNTAKHLKEVHIEEQRPKLSEEDNIKLGTLQKFREMVLQNDSEFKRKEINEYQHKERNKETSKLIDEYEEKYGTKDVG